MARRQNTPTAPLMPVAIATVRDGEPYMLFGKHIGGDSPYGLTGQTLSEYVAEHGHKAPFHMIPVEDGPDITKWEAIFEHMERIGVVMLIDPSQDRRH